VSRFVNVDRFLQEVDEEPITIRLFGKKWELPGDAPADAIVRARRARQLAFELAERAERDPNEALSEDEVEHIRATLGFDFDKELRRLVGDTLVDQWIATGKLGYRKLRDLFWHIVDVYEDGGDGEDEPEDEAEPVGEAPAPKKGARKPATRSSKTSTSSKPTSKGSTAQR
jgi:hypothetical protein